MLQLAPAPLHANQVQMLLPSVVESSAAPEPQLSAGRRPCEYMHQHQRQSELQDGNLLRAPAVPDLAQATAEQQKVEPAVNGEPAVGGGIDDGELSGQNMMLIVMFHSLQHSS